MTPPAAATAAARTAVGTGPARARRRASVAVPAHAPTRRAPGPRIPRRVSGPAPAPKRAPRPTFPRPRPRVVPRRPTTTRPLGRTLVELVASLPDRPIVERAIRGRWWIGVLAVMLFGLVVVQVSLLKLNAGIGSAVEQTAALERANGELRAQVSRLSSGERIQAKAGQIGMVLPPAGEIHFIRPGQGDAAAAAAAISDGRFGSDQQATAQAGLADQQAAADTGQALPPANGNTSTATTTTSTAASATGAAGSTDTSQSTNILNDGNPNNDYLADGNPNNDNPGGATQ